MPHKLFFDRNISCCETVETIRGTLEGENISVAREIAILVKADGDDADAALRKAAKATAIKKFKAWGYLMKIDKHCCGELICNLENNYSLGTHQWPDTMSKGFKAIIRFCPDQKAEGLIPATGLSFIQPGGEKLGVDKKS